MSRSADAVHLGMLAHLPPGWIWPRDTSSMIATLLRPVAEEIADIEATAEAMMAEVDPRSATLCIDDFERVLGPDPCGRDPADLELTARQSLTHQRWTARGGQSRAYFIELAARRGVEITIEEAHTSQAGGLRAGDELVNSPEQFVWIVSMALGSWQVFRAGQSGAGERLYDFDLADIECDIRRAKPAHTEVAFRYVELAETTLAFDGWLRLTGDAPPSAEIEISWQEL